MRKYFPLIQFLLLLVLGQSTFLFSQPQKEILAKIGNTIISKNDFVKRYEAIPHLRSELSNDSSATKLEFLYTLIAEKLLAQQARTELYDKSKDYKMIMSYLRNIYLRDALYKIEVKDKVTISKSEMINGLEKIKRSVHTRFIFSKDEVEIRKLYSDIKNGASFDSLLATRSESAEQEKVKEVTFGTMDRKLEELIFSLKPGEVTSPVRLQEGWYICKVYSVSDNTNNDIDVEKKVRRIVSSRIEDEIYQDFYKRIFKGINVNADSKIFANVVAAIFEYCKENKNNFSRERNNKYRLGEKELSEIKSKLSRSDLNSMFIKFTSNPLTLEQFYENLILEGIEIDAIEESDIRRGFNSFVRNFIQNEVLAREAIKRGYNNLPEVVSDLKEWQDYYLSKLFMKKIFTKEIVSDKEAYNFFIKSDQIIASPDKIKIAEILVHDLETIETILNELDKGTEFSYLARKYTLRDSLRDKGGEFGYSTISELGELGEPARKMKTGDVAGPIKNQEGYSIIKLLDRKEGEKIKYDKFESIKENIKEIIKTNKMYKNLDEITARLADANGIEINENSLRSLKVTNINMIIFRRFGFGGQLLAAPFSQNNSSWFKTYQQLKKKSPL